MDGMKYRTKRDLLTGFVILAIGVFVGYIIGNRGSQQHNVILENRPMFLKSEDIVHSDPPKCPTCVAVRLTTKYDIEYNFTETIRSCLGPECFDARPQGSSLDRVGILALPGSGVQVILVVLRKAIRNSKPKTEIILDSHVPAYGYGKNHGWSRIVRISRGVIPHAYSLLKGIHHNGSNIPSSAFVLQVRQLARWHCRLSHVAAHTKMLT
eukprot:gene7460-15265_t